MITIRFLYVVVSRFEKSTYVDELCGSSDDCGYRSTFSSNGPVVLTEYILVSVTSAVTVTIAGVVKEAVTILVAVFYFHDQFTWLKGVGLFTIMVGVSLFNWYKYLKLQTGHSKEVDMGDTAGDIAGSLKSNINARYVILEEVDEQEDST
ncbi:putative sugar phosphate/phosphate translocator [Vitis vinifera]|uniref:Putative sugar phosphate/phosphate translocator n=1 Tax=Vitis vinifera TaxID=29760 RepID=A0A438HN66_VITVI|nr:putative sugar phosphate/phosphate translocator [Vitis vinifera]